MIYVTGDLHGDETRFFSKEFKQLKAGDTLIVTGDFGFIWNGSKKERKLLKYLGARPYNICFLEGPNDNYRLIHKYRETIWKGGRVHRVSGSLFHLCRGQIYNIEGCSIFTFGGGELSDNNTPPENIGNDGADLPTSKHFGIGIKNLENSDRMVDFIITHEPPAVVKRAMQQRFGSTIYTNILNGYLERINRYVDFSHWYFGQFHEDKQITPKHTSVFERLIAVNDGYSGKVPINQLQDEDYFEDVRLVNELSDDSLDDIYNDDTVIKMPTVADENEEDFSKKFVDDII